VGDKTPRICLYCGVIILKHKCNQDYWIPKLERNIQRDKEVTEKLLEDNWIVLRFWETDIKRESYEIATSIKNVIISLK